MVSPDVLCCCKPENREGVKYRAELGTEEFPDVVIHHLAAILEALHPLANMWPCYLNIIDQTQVI